MRDRSMAGRTTSADARHRISEDGGLVPSVDGSGGMVIAGYRRTEREGIEDRETALCRRPVGGLP